MPGPKRAAVQTGGTIRRPESRRLRSIGAAGPGGFRKSESDEADGRRGRRGWRCRREARFAGRKAGACGRSGPQGREASGKANRTEQTGAGIPEAVRGCRSRRGRRCRREARFAGRRAGRLPEKRTGRNRRVPGYRKRFGGAGAEKEGIRKRQTNKRLRCCACVSTIVRKPNFFVPGRSRIPSNGNKNATDRYESIVFHK